jgi:hypothetical protein
MCVKEEAVVRDYIREIVRGSLYSFINGTVSPPTETA